MPEKIKEEHRIYRLPPCPSYDVEGMESWLTQMAHDGFMLEKDGFFMGVASFRRTEPQQIRFRLDAAQQSTSMWADNWGEPDPEAVELNRIYQWEYMGKRGDFYIYCCHDEKSRELNTDPKVQALALDAVKSRNRVYLFQTIFWLAVYPLIQMHIGFFLLLVEMKTWYILLSALMIMLSIWDSVEELVFLHRIQRQLRTYGYMIQNGDRRKTQLHYYLKKSIILFGIVIWVIVSLNLWSNAMLDKNKIPISEYEKKPPFASLSELRDSEVVQYKPTMMGHAFNVVTDESDWLYPRNIVWSEYADVKWADGTVFRGMEDIKYHEARTAWLARQLAKDYYRQSARRKRFEPLASPNLEADYVSAFIDEFHFSTLIIQKDNIVVCAAYRPGTEDTNLSFHNWAVILYNSLFGK